MRIFRRSVPEFGASLLAGTGAGAEPDERAVAPKTWCGTVREPPRISAVETLHIQLVDERGKTQRRKVDRGMQKRILWAAFASFAPLRLIRSVNQLDMQG